MQNAFPEAGHDHHHCAREAVDRAEQAFKQQHVRMTDLRRMVLNEIASSHKAVGAYDLMASLATRGHRLAPISVYRALEALAGIGAIHRLESRNAFFACHNRHDAGSRPIVLVCETCLCVAEVESPAAIEAMELAVAATGFKTSRRVLEMAGSCAPCQAAGRSVAAPDGPEIAP